MHTAIYSQQRDIVSFFPWPVTRIKLIGLRQRHTSTDQKSRLCWSPGQCRSHQWQTWPALGCFATGKTSMGTWRHSFHDGYTRGCLARATTCCRHCEPGNNNKHHMPQHKDLGSALRRAKNSKDAGTHQNSTLLLWWWLLKPEDIWKIITGHFASSLFTHNNLRYSPY